MSAVAEPTKEQIQEQIKQIEHTLATTRYPQGSREMAEQKGKLVSLKQRLAALPKSNPSATNLATNSVAPQTATIFTSKNITIGIIVLAALFVIIKYETIAKIFK